MEFAPRTARVLLPDGTEREVLAADVAAVSGLVARYGAIAIVGDVVNGALISAWRCGRSAATWRPKRRMPY